MFNIPIKWVAIPGLLMAALWTIARGVVVGQINRRLDNMRVRGFFTKKKYLLALREQLAEMPFLYKDMRLSVRDDYVEMVISTADRQILPMGNPKVDRRAPVDRFVESRRAVLFGDGGYGKSTIFRNIILRMIDNSSFFGRRSYPIFIALKAIKLSSDFPILECIQASAPIFEGDDGYRRLERLARQRKLAIFLDGYDEMPYIGSLNHAVEEIETLFKKKGEENKNFFENKKPFYSYAQGCRIYLSSRREFFFLNPLKVDSNVPNWLVRGLGDRRGELVDKIFSRYEKNVPIFNGRLDQERFLQQLTEGCDAHLIALSYSPLFLTVMCYIYVDALKQNTNSDGGEVFLLGAHGLVEKCIDLLISDVDEYKARGLSEARRSALIGRRSAFRSEKLFFLKRFAAKLYENDDGIFTRKMLVDEARLIFTGVDSGDAKILEGLDSLSPVVNIVDQLIYSGLFVVVDFRREDQIYDFPHRSFREALAVSYFSSEETYAGIVEKFDLPSYSELALIFVRQSLYGFKIFEAIFSKVERETYENRHGSFLLDALRRVGRLECEQRASKFFDLLSERTALKAPKLIMECLPNNDQFGQFVMNKLIISADKKSPSVGLWFTVMVSRFEMRFEAQLLDFVRKADVASLREAMYAPLILSETWVSAITDRMISLAYTRSDLEQNLFDIYRALVKGKHANKGVVRACMSKKMVHMRELFGLEQSEPKVFLDEIENVFGNVEVPDQRGRLIRPTVQARTAVIPQLFE